MRGMTMAVLAALISALAVGAGEVTAQPLRDPLEAAIDLGREDPVAGATAMRRLAQADDPRAQWFYGMFLLNGRGVARDEAEAWTWVKASADGGHVEGMISAAVMLAMGQGVAEDDVAARGWYRKAAESGSAHALRGLGGMIFIGEGGPAERVRGLAYLEMARDAGDDYARQILHRLNIVLNAEERQQIEGVKADWKRQFGAPK